MKRKKVIGLCIVSLVILVFLANTLNGKRISQTKKNIPNPLTEYLRQRTEYFTVKNCPALDKAWAKFLDETSKTLPGKEIYYTQDYTLKPEEIKEVKKFNVKNYHSFNESIDFKTLETSALSNDECGLKSSLLASIIYDGLEMKDKENETHLRLVNFANENNPYAVEHLCNYSAPIDERIRFCEIVFNQKDNSIFDKKEANYAGSLLIYAYSEKKQPMQLLKVCEKITDGQNSYDEYKGDCYFKLKSLADDIYREKNHKQASFFYEKLINFWEGVRQNDTPHYDDKTREIILVDLKDIYFNLGNVDKFIDVCKLVSDDFIKEICGHRLETLGKKLYNKKKYNEAIELYTKATDIFGDGNSAFNLGDMYLNGDVVPKNLALAIDWYDKALFNLESYHYLRPLVLNQMGVAYNEQTDYVNAFDCYSKAAALGYVTSQLNLASMYASGQGTLQDFKTAYAWISIAITQGIKNKEHYANAIYLKNSLTQTLMRDQTKTALNDAKTLAQQYYVQYVPHKMNMLKWSKNHR